MVFRPRGRKTMFERWLLQQTNKKEGRTERLHKQELWSS